MKHLTRSPTHRTLRVTVRPKGLAYLPLRHIKAQLPDGADIYVDEYTKLNELCEMAWRYGYAPVVELKRAVEAERIFERDEGAR